MKLQSVCLFILLCTLIFSCKKDTPNKIQNSSIPSNIIYQLQDSNGVFITIITCKLYPSNNGVYFDSVVIHDYYFLNFSIGYYFDTSRFTSERFLIQKFTNPGFYQDSLIKPIVEFNSNNQISMCVDNHSLLTGENDEYFRDNFTYSNFGTHTSVLSGIGNNVHMTVDRSIIVRSFSDDSMNLDKSPYSDYLSSNTIIFDNKNNNTQLLSLSGYDPLFNNFTSDIGYSNIFSNVKLLPFPGLQTKLVKSIYVTHERLVIHHKKVQDYDYEFDTDDRVTKATVTNYDLEGNTTSVFRILFNY